MGGGFTQKVSEVLKVLEQSGHKGTRGGEIDNPEARAMFARRREVEYDADDAQAVALIILDAYKRFQWEEGEYAYEQYLRELIAIALSVEEIEEPEFTHPNIQSTIKELPNTGIFRHPQLATLVEDKSPPEVAQQISQDYATVVQAIKEVSKQPYTPPPGIKD